MVNVSYTSSGDLSVSTTDDQSIVYNLGDIAWVLASTAFVWIMIPGLSFFYSGLLRRKNALSMIWVSMMTGAVVAFQWFFWGFSLAFSETGSPFIGDLKYFGLKGVLEQPSIGSPRIPSIVYCVYQLMFAAVTPIIAVGAVAERGKLGPLMVFVFAWSTLVYDPIACWTWNANGWSFVLGGLDFSGGSPVHISSGTAALAISWYLGKRRGYGTERLAYKPQNVSYVVLGTVLIWFGWFGFNGGSTLSANLRAAQTCFVTNLAASCGGLTWMLWDYRHQRKWSIVGFCAGAIAGLVAITPAAGFVGSPAAVAFGFVAGTVCNFSTQLKFIFGFDDALDIFASHTIGGIAGNIMTAFFAQASVAGFDGLTVIKGGWFDHHWVQLGYQLAGSCASFSYSLAMTLIILYVMDLIPGLSMRVDEESEIIGIDDAEMGEFAYDYVGLEVEIGHSVSMEAESSGAEEEANYARRYNESSAASSSDEKDPAAVTVESAN